MPEDSLFDSLADPGIDIFSVAWRARNGVSVEPFAFRFYIGLLSSVILYLRFNKEAMKERT